MGLFLRCLLTLFGTILIIISVFLAFVPVKATSARYVLAGRTHQGENYIRLEGFEHQFPMRNASNFVKSSGEYNGDLHFEWIEEGQWYTTFKYYETDLLNSYYLLTRVSDQYQIRIPFLNQPFWEGYKPYEKWLYYQMV